jgi:hypothetical protein
MAISKAQTGNLGALKRLGVPLSDTIIKSKDLAAANDVLTKSYGGAAAANADTFAGKIAIFNQRIGEAKEAIGTAILQAIQPFADKWLPKISKGVTDVVDGFLGKKGKGAGISLGQSIRTVADAIGNFIQAINKGDDGKQKSLSQNIQSIADAFNSIAIAIGKVQGAYEALQRFLDTGAGKRIEKAMSFLPTNVLIRKFMELGKDNKPHKAMGGSVMGGKSFLVGEHGPEYFTPGTTGTLTPNHRLGGQIIININGIVDAESARRSIENLLQTSGLRRGAVNVNRLAI